HAEVFRELEHHGIPLLSRQLVYRNPDGMDPGALDHDIDGVSCSGAEPELIVERDLAPLVAVMTRDRVDRDSIEPAGEWPPPVLITLDGPKGAQEDLGGNVLGLTVAVH